MYLDTQGTQSRVLTHTVNGGTSHNQGIDFYGKEKLSSTLTSWRFSS